MYFPNVGDSAFSYMTNSPPPMDDVTTQYRLAELERAFREFKNDWHTSTTAVGTTLAAIQNQLTAMSVRSEETRSLSDRLKKLEDRPDSSVIKEDVKVLQDRSWQVLVAILLSAGGLLLEVGSRVKLP
jgi:hypothetical protein